MENLVKLLPVIAVVALVVIIFLLGYVKAPPDVAYIISGDSDDRDAEDDEEDARAFYVGATRARHELEIITCRKMYQEKLEVSEFVPRLLAAGKGD